MDFFALDFLALDLMHVAAGSLVGFIIGLTGVGGGSLMTPILVLGFGISPAIAVGTDLLYAAITKASGVFFHHRNKTVDWTVVGLLALGSVPSALITVSLLEYLKAAGLNSDKLMMLTLSIMLILTSFIIVIKGRLVAYVTHHHGDSTFVTAFKRYRPHLTVFSGVALGILVTISSVGAGAIGSAILFLLYPKKKPIQIVGTDIAHAVPLTAIAGMGHLHLGSVDFDLLAGLLMGGIPAIYFGSLFGRHIPDKYLKTFIALLLLAMGVKLAL
ncbi:MAG: sulfite exporter TauE/SafE family protein [Methyloprofundus sp.]|nr:sulfite exporter TauE/SafE family protein [Methyloprofundus sp.]